MRLCVGLTMLAACTKSRLLASYWSARYGRFLQVSAISSHWLADFANFTPIPGECGKILFAFSSYLIKYFLRILRIYFLRIRRRFCVPQRPFSSCMLNYFPRILRIRLNTFPQILHRHTNTFSLFSEYAERIGNTQREMFTFNNAWRSKRYSILRKSNGGS